MSNGNKIFGRRFALILCNQPSVGVHDLFSRKSEELHQKADTISTEFDSSISLLEKILNRPLRTIKPEVDIRRTYFNYFSLVPRLSKEMNNLIRIVFHPGNELHINNVSNFHLDTSHLVLFTSGNLGWCPSAHSKITCLQNDNHELFFSAAVDICIDITMYHYFINKLSYYCKNTRRSREFSKKKVEYVLRNGQQSFHGPVQHDAHYVSFASVCRQGLSHTINTATNIYNMWDDFITSITPADNAITASRIVNELKIYHERYHQLDLKKIGRDISFLDKGKYCLITINARPNMKIDAENIYRLFNRTSWKMNAYVIIRCDEKTMFSKYRQWLRYYDFTVV